MTTTPNKHMKKSLGIILFDSSKTNVVVIKKRYTYEYFDMVYGRYIKNDTLSIRKLVSAMTINEKNILRSNNFDYIWFHIHLNFIKTDKYYRAYTIFTNAFMLDNGILLNSILDTSPYRNTINYELPKGKKNRTNEPNIFTAIREMEEETQIQFSDVNIDPYIKRTITETTTDTKYTTVFYVGVIKKSKHPSIDEMCREQLTEIEDVKLVDMNTLRNHVDLDIYQMIKKISKLLKNKSKILPTVSADIP
jgi:hypothetical protein